MNAAETIYVADIQPGDLVIYWTADSVFDRMPFQTPSAVASGRFFVTSTHHPTPSGGLATLVTLHGVDRTGQVNAVANLHPARRAVVVRVSNERAR